MGEFGSASQRKIERAEKHIGDLDALLKLTSGTRHHSLSVEQDVDGLNWLSLQFDSAALPADDAALILGDALHNLRSALDILWHEIIWECKGSPTHFSRFLIEDTEEELITRLNCALKDKRISKGVRDFVLDTIKPYQAGNYSLWALDDLNIRDKHQLIIPVLKWMWI